jgi:hypothetical protein|tara:strand:+ start:1012 stop:1251 length:240 start_codon:yes stop_codon:yes gene_type:complete
MLDKIKIKLLVSGVVVAIISVFTLILTWMGTSLWWLLSGDMVQRLTFLYIYLTLTLISVAPLLVGMLIKYWNGRYNNLD